MSETEFVQQGLQAVRRIVVKVGTNLLRGEQEGLNLERMDHLAAQMAELRRQGKELILVSSGAVGAGTHLMGLAEPPREIHKRQALAAIGQSRLMHHYMSLFRQYGVRVAQVLLTRDNLDDRQRYLNARSTFEVLLHWGVLPIVNENDTVAVEELRFGDNDQLSALIAGKIDADLLVILTDVEGVFDRPPSDPEARRIPVWREHAVSEVRLEGGPGSRFGLGGMQSKLKAVRLATRAGILVNIGCGRTPHILLRILAGEEVGTWFEPRHQKISARKRWLAFGKRLCDGRIRVDAGAEAALRDGGKSLLPSGVVEVEGRFRKGDLVQVCSLDAREIARGLVQFSSEELLSIMGRKTPEVAAVLGKRRSYEVIHRDDMVVLERGESV